MQIQHFSNSFSCFIFNSRIESRGHLSESPLQRESSLTSVQRLVLQQLRDRPPRYEDTNHIQLEKAPPYQEGDTNCEVPSILFYAAYVPNCILLFFPCFVLEDSILKHKQCNISIVIFSATVKRNCNNP
jgi:hypothetical protein